MTNQEMQNLYNALRQLPDTKTFKFDYAVIKNLKILGPEVEALNEMLKPDEGFMNFENARMKICETYAVKNEESGTPKIENGMFVFPDSDTQAIVTKEIDELRNAEPHKTTIDNREAKMKEFQELLKEESKVELYRVKMENVPDGIPRNLLDAILPMIQE